MIVTVHHVMIVMRQEVYAGAAVDLKVAHHSWMMFEEAHPEVVMIFAFVPTLTRRPLWID
jgi:uncharacterized membrane protein YeiH